MIDGWRIFPSSFCHKMNCLIAIIKNNFLKGAKIIYFLKVFLSLFWSLYMNRKKLSAQGKSMKICQKKELIYNKFFIICYFNLFLFPLFFFSNYVNLAT